MIKTAAQPSSQTPAEYFSDLLDQNGIYLGPDKSSSSIMESKSENLKPNPTEQPESSVTSNDAIQTTVSVTKPQIFPKIAIKRSVTTRKNTKPNLLYRRSIA